MVLCTFLAFSACVAAGLFARFFGFFGGSGRFRSLSGAEMSGRGACGGRSVGMALAVALAGLMVLAEGAWAVTVDVTKMEFCKDDTDCANEKPCKDIYNNNVNGCTYRSNMGNSAKVEVCTKNVSACGAGYDRNDIIVKISNSTDLTLTGTNTMVRVIISGNSTLNIEDLTLQPDGEITPPIDIDGTATLILHGLNLLKATSSAAGIWVRPNSKLTIKEGKNGGTLIAQGGPNGVGNQGGGAGIGGMGGCNDSRAPSVYGTATVTTTGGDCGIVIIESGTITASGGGGSGQRGAGAGIGGGGGTGQGQGSPPAGGKGCYLYINGGVVKATAFHQENYIGGGADARSQGYTYGTGGFVRINGGSVDVDSINIYDNFTSNRSVGTKNLRKYAIQLGSLYQPPNTAIKSCKFGSLTCDNIGSDTTNLTSKYGINGVKTNGRGMVYFWLPSANAPKSGDSIKTTMGYGRPYNSTGCNAAPAECPFPGVGPSMEVPISPPNFFVGKEEDAGEKLNGPYVTGFRTNIIYHVGAVGHPIKLVKGKYLQNDARDEAVGTKQDGSAGTVHTIRWYVTDARKYDGSPDEILGVGRPINRGTTANPIYVESFVSGNADHEISGEFIPTAAEYGRYVYAKVFVRDNTTNDTFNESVAVTYPAVKIGVVVNIKMEADGTSVSTTNLCKAQANQENKSGETYRCGGEVYVPNPFSTMKAGASWTQNGSPPIDGNNLVTDITSDREGVKPLFVTASVSGLGSLLKYTWSWEPTSFSDNYTASGGFNYGVGQTTGQVITEPSTSPSSSYAVPFWNISGNRPNNDITLTVKLQDGSTPKLESLNICNSPTTPATSVCTEYFIDEDGLYRKEDNGVINRNKVKIPKKGTIKLTFDQPITNITGPIMGGPNNTTQVVPKGLLYLSPAAGGEVPDTTLNAEISPDQKSFSWSYGNTRSLKAGTKYLLVIDNYANRVPNRMQKFSEEFIAEQKAIVEFITDSDNYKDGYKTTAIGNATDGALNSNWPNNANKFIVGDLIKVGFNYPSTQISDVGAATGTEYYWEVRENLADSSNLKAGTYSFDGAYSSFSGSSSSGSTMPIPSLRLVETHFGKWIRLVVRPEGTISIDGSKKGEVLATTFKRVGLLLAPGVDENKTCDAAGSQAANTCKNYTNVTLNYCDASNPDEGISGCQGDGTGIIVYNKEGLNGSGFRIAATPGSYKVGGVTKDFKITGWKDDSEPVNECTIGKPASNGFDCATNTTYYKITTVPKAGKITLTPIATEIALPTVASVTLSSLAGTNLVNISPSNVKIAAQTLTITFKNGYDTEGSVKIVGEKDNLSSSSSGTDDDGKSYIVYNLPKRTFNTNYVISVSGFKMAGDEMRAETFSFTTGDAPNIAGVTLSASSVGYAVGHAINAILGSYSGNGGSSSSGTHSCKWQSRSGNSVSDISGATGCSGYTPTGAIYGKEIRLSVTPKDANGDGTREVNSDWQLVGVLLKASSDPNGVVQIGSADVSASSAGVVVNGKTTITYTPNDGYKLGVLGSDPTCAACFSGSAFTPSVSSTCSNENCDITISASSVPGVRPTVAGSIATGATGATVDSLVLSFDIAISSATTGGTVTITGTGGPWTYSVKTGTGGEWSEDKKRLAIPYTSIVNSSSQAFAVATGQTYTASITDSAYVDANGNTSVKNPNLITISNNAHYSIALNRNITKKVTYGSYAENVIGTINIQNTSNVPITLSASSAAASNNIIAPSVTNSAINPSSSATLTLNLTQDALNLGVGEHTGIVTITYGNGITDSVTVSLTVQPKKITPASLATLYDPPARVYDGTDTAITITTPNITITTCASIDKTSNACDTSKIMVVASGGTFADKNVGINKTIAVNFKIQGTSALNYTFGSETADREDEYSYPGLKGTINPKPLTITLPNNPVVTKDYDGLSTHDLSNDSLSAFALGKIGDEDVKLENVSFSFADPNAATNKPITGMNFNLAGSDVGNYSRVVPDLSGKTGTINSASLASVVHNTSLIITAKATYGKELDKTTRWEEPPEGDVVNSKSQALAGSWKICNLTSTTPSPSGCENPPMGIVYPAGTTDIMTVKAYFDPTDKNYKNDVVKDLKIKVEPKELAVRVNDISKLGDKGFGIKTYDSEKTISGTAKLTVTGFIDIDKDVSDLVTGKDGQFENANVGADKLLNIALVLKSGFGNKYKLPSDSVTQIGQILQRPVCISGFNALHKYYDGTTDAKVDVSTHSFEKCKDPNSSANIAASGLMNADVSKVRLDVKAGNEVFKFSSPTADNNKTITTSDEDAFSVVATTGGGDAYKNYKVSFSNTRASILRGTIANYFCRYAKVGSADFNTDKSKCAGGEGKFMLTKDTIDEKKKMNDWFISKSRTLDIATQLIGDPNNAAKAVYGDKYSEVSGRLSEVLPISLEKVMGGGYYDDDNKWASDNTIGSWSWSLQNDLVPGVNDILKDDKIPWAKYRQTNPNYVAVDSVQIPLKVSPKQLEIANITPIPRDYLPCIESTDPNVYCPDKAKTVDLAVVLSGVVSKNGQPDFGNDAVKATGTIDNYNAGTRSFVGPISISWARTIPVYANYALPTKLTGYNIDDVVIGKAEYTGTVPEPIIAVMNIPNNRTALVYDRDRYPNISLVNFETSGWYWANMGAIIPDPQGIQGKDFIDATFDAEYVLDATAAATGNYRPKEEKITLKVYKRSEDKSLSKTSPPSMAFECGSETVDVKVTATNQYATIWFRGNQYGEENTGVGTFSVSGMRYGSNRIDYRVNAQAYGLGEDYYLYYTRLLPFNAVAKAPQGGKSLTVTLDFQDTPEFENINRYLSSNSNSDIPASDRIDLSKTKWFKGQDSIGKGLILPVNSTSANDIGGYSLILYSKNDKPVIASCKQLGGKPDLPDSLDYLPVSTVPKLVATPYGTRIVAGGTSLLFNTPNGGKVSIYTMKGELVSRMTVVEDRTVVKLPATRGIYIVKLEAK